MNVLSKIIDTYYNMKTSISNSKLNGSNKISSMEVKKIKNDCIKLNSQNDLRDLKFYINYKKQMSKTLLINIFILIGTIVSLSVTFAGTDKIDILDISTFTTVNLVYVLAISFIQVTIYYLTSIERTIKDNHSDYYNIFKVAQWLVVSISIYYNIKFFYKYFDIDLSFNKDFIYNLIQFIPIIILCIALDLIIVILLKIKHDMKFGLTSKKMNDLETYLQNEKDNQKEKGKTKDEEKEKGKTEKLEKEKEKRRTIEEKEKLEKEKGKNEKEKRREKEEKEKWKKEKGNEVIVSMREKKKQLMFNNIKNYVMTHYKLNDRINPKEIQEHFNITPKVYYKYNNMLKDEGIVIVTPDKKTEIIKVLENGNEIMVNQN